MRKFLLSIVLLLVCVVLPLNAQIKLQYSPGTTTFTPLAGGNNFVTGYTGTKDEGYSAPVAIGFPFSYAGASYDSFQVSTNGFLRLGSGLTSATASNALAGLMRRVIAPLWDDLAVVDSSLDLKYELSGTTPNRVLTVEWRNVKWPAANATANAEFQVKLYETGGKIEFVYGTFGTPGTVSASIGLSDNSTIGTANRATGTFLSFNIGGTAGARAFYQTQGLEFAAVANAPDNNTMITFTAPGAPMTGTYTVGGTTPDFASLSIAANALNTRGVSGPVTLNIRPGIYEDVFHLVKITGASHTNRVTVTKESGDVTISPRYGARTSNTVLAADAMVRLDGASFVTFDGLKLVDNALNTTTALKYDCGIVLTNSEVSPVVTGGSRFNVFKNLFIDMDAQTIGHGAAIGIRSGTTVTTAAADTSFTNSYNTFQDLTIERFWRAAIQLYGFTGALPDRGNKITAVAGRNAFRNINVTAGAASDIRAIEANAQYDFTIEKTDIYDLIVNLPAWTATNLVSGIRLNPANSTTDYNWGNILIQNVNVYNLEMQQTAATTASALGIEVLRLGYNSTLTIKNCRVSDVFSNGSTTSLTRGIVVNSGAGVGTVTTVNVYNNLVYDIRGPRSTSAPGVRAFDIQNSASGLMNANLSYNTAYLDSSVSASAIATHQSAVIYWANFGTSSLDLRNNIFVNLQNSPTRAVVLYPSANTNLIRLAPTSNNNLYYAGIPGTTRAIAYDGATTFQTLAAYQAGVFSGGLGGPREMQSVTEMPPFVSAVAPYDLNIQTAVATQAEGAGKPVAGITTDYAGGVRSTTKPDLGAYEFAGTALDLTAPAIAYTPLLYTGTVGARNLVVNVTDPSGVPTVTPGWPTVYVKIGVNGTYSAVTPTTVTGSNYTFSIGGAAVAGDTVYYYAVAQDNAATPNVGAVPFTGASGFTANPPAVSTPPTNPYGYIVTSAALSGDFTVGTATFNRLTGKNIYFEKVVNRVTKQIWVNNPVTGKDDPYANEPVLHGIYDENRGSWQNIEVEDVTWKAMENGAPYTGSLIAKKTDNPQIDFPSGVEGIYATLTAAINDLNLSGVSGNVNFLLTDTLYSTGETFPYIPYINNENQPSASKKITIKPNTGVVAKISGAPATGIMANYVDYLTIDGSNSGGTDRSLTIENTGTTASSYVLGIFNNLGDAAQNVTIKNTILRAGVSGATTTWNIILNASGGDFDNTTITNNWFQKANTAIQFVGVSGAVTNNGVITNNLFGHDDPALTISNTGILTQFCDAVTISGNTFKNFVTASTNPSAIIVSTGTVNTQITGNTISGMYYTGTGGYAGKGISVSTLNLNSNVVIANNSIAGMKGDGWNNFTSDSHIGIRVLGGTGGVKIYYNSINMYGTFSKTTGTWSAGIFVQGGTANVDLKNNSVSNSLFNSGTTGVAKNYAIATDALVMPFSSNYNNFFVSGTQGILGLVTTTDVTTLAGWQTGTGGDANSKNVDPLYTDTTNLRPALGSPIVFAGTTVPGYTTDILGATRTATPSIGAYEFPAGVNVGWANLQWPATGNILVGRSITVYGQIWVDGVTNQPGQATGISAWLGYSTENTDPSTWTNWIPSTFNVDAGNNDEYQTNIGATLAPGTYYYAYRYQVYGNPYYYGGYNQGGGGQWNGTSNVSGVLTVQAPFTVNWEASAATTSLPAWMGTGNTERGLAWGMVNTPTEGLVGRVVVPARKWGNSVKLLHDSTGVLVDSLNVTGLAGGTLQINDAEVDHLGRIYACNLTTSTATDPFKVYRWDNTASVPKVVLSYTGDAVRLGDKFTVNYDSTTRGVVIWAASATSAQPKVYKFANITGLDSINQVPVVVNLSDNISTALGSASVGPLYNGDFYWKGTGSGLRKYTAAGSIVDTIPGTVVATGSNAVRFIGKVNGSEFIAVFQYGAGNNNVRVVEVPNGNPKLAVTYGVSPSMGANANANGTGDVAVKRNYDGSHTVFVLATNNGIGSYKAIQNIPVEFSAFSAEVKDRDVNLAWKTATETNSASFNVERTVSGTGKWTSVGSVAAAGTSTQTRSYTFTDKGLNSAKYQYRLKQIDLDGTYSYSSVIEVEVGMPMTFALGQNYPNPFNPVTRIEYQVPSNSKVSLELYDISGQKVASLVNTELGSGYYSFDLSAGKFGLASGVYLYRMTAVDMSTGKNFVNTKKMVMLK